MKRAWGIGAVALVTAMTFAVRALEDDPEGVLHREINAMRGAGSTCGQQRHVAVAKVERSPTLDRLARDHAQDMATRGFFDHVSPDDLGPVERARRAGYRGQVAENLAWGQTDATGVIEAWRRSVHHCRSVMQPQHRAVGIARVVGNRKLLWVAVFGSSP